MMVMNAPMDAADGAAATAEQADPAEHDGDDRAQRETVAGGGIAARGRWRRGNSPPAAAQDSGQDIGHDPRPDHVDAVAAGRPSGRYRWRRMATPSELRRKAAPAARASSGEYRRATRGRWGWPGCSYRVAGRWPPGCGQDADGNALVDRQRRQRHQDRLQTPGPATSKPFSNPATAPISRTITVTRPMLGRGVFVQCDGGDRVAHVDDAADGKIDPPGSGPPAFGRLPAAASGMVSLTVVVISNPPGK